LLPAGFYYKTFMWPERLWEPLYERTIRRVAGLGRAPSEPDPDRYGHAHAHCDGRVAGGGPAGLTAALAAGRSGARVILADEQAELGGSLLAEPADGGVRIGDRPAAAWLEAMTGELAALPEVRLLPRTTVFGYYDHNFLGLIERAEGGPVRQRLWKVRAGRVVLATGAIERPPVFAGNDLPGVVLAGAARTYVNRYGVRPGSRAVLLTTNDGAYATALDLHRAGVEVAAVVDARPEPAGEMPNRARAAGLRLLAGRAVVGAEGRRRLRAVRVMALAGDRVRGEAETIACDLLAVSGGWNPAVHLFSQSRGRLRFEPERGVFLPGEPVQRQASAGACNGAFSLGACLAEGAAAGLEAARAAGLEPDPLEVPATTEPAEAPMRLLWRVPPDGPRAAKAFVDLQNDVTAADLELAVREGYRSIEHVKRYTTTGMGTDQGKTANVNALAIVAEATGASIAEVGTTTFRPPYTPVTFGAVVGLNRGRLFDPVRTTPIHPWHEAHGARFEDVGQWKRAWYYPRDGETMREAVGRECRAAREAAGIMDASTLGKIDIRGPDAAELLNRVYTNAWSGLEVGRCRYGLMLREDGMVFDDGVTARLGERHYLMSTTTGNAARVLAWLEEWLQTEWPELKVYCTSVTEQYATVSLSGPRCREVLRRLTDLDLDPDAFPHMAVREAEVAGVPARVFRVSFTGEVSYELQVPASYGLAVWEACMAAGAEFGITPYGTEAMHVLRAEKGYIIVGQETDGTVTPFDLGMEWIVGRRKP
ncbi:MAG TPA: FAD-dependent oxidoreductase, partial [Geminicoccaceae bacterium]|nr:FAD-dependent oxidoreductase [Geminicoccaceae bacterium]